jgi:hypothetical protein
VAKDLLTYQIEYVPPGQRSVTATYACERWLQAGQWIEVNGLYLFVERIVYGKPGHYHHAGIALCKPAVGASSQLAS